ncbi:Z1 domain-containing protein [Nocardioides dongxiaopingii]|uniref:Z1 domain-containing protein n=1 Tax=Nocardioides dongxiaopingii TaxID=2576036 RepID=UPI0010C761F1|nr:Z1 domain-containing protein [Nocardioides dongxiaopingii]
MLEKSFGEQSRSVISADASFIVDRCIFADPVGTGEEDEVPSRERRGVVMGAVQSGKTASMLAVIAKSLDAGIDAVVVLGGTRTVLWLQTWERLLAQVDTHENRHLRRVMLPTASPTNIAEDGMRPGLYNLTSQQAKRAVANKRPIVVVAMKQVAHLERVAHTLREVVYPAVASADRPFRLLVIDDEADDSSIAENDLTTAASIQERQVPRRILDLWESRQRPGETAIKQLQATYLAYTATPQANFLQDQSNPLAPKDFVVCLRTPGASGNEERREPSYRVHEGVPGWYTGGDVYYKGPTGSIPLCMPTDTMPEAEQLQHAVRGYLVASALRLARAPGTPEPSWAAAQIFETSIDAKTAGGPVMSMLVHPSAAMNAHFETAEHLLEWSAGLGEGEGAALVASGQVALGVTGIVEDMDSQTHRWTQWLDNYNQSNEVVAALEGDAPTWPGLGWVDLRAKIVDEIVPVTTVAVINSDERSSDRPVFEPVQSDDGWRVAPNLSTIFVSGNVMSRGLTLEGLSTTLFTRTSDEPASDTQMQMQRWFGYRGRYIDVCRVLMPRLQIDLFRDYHETDVALRLQILDAMTDDEPAPPTVLQGRNYRATAKVRNVRGRALWPGATPFTTWLNPPDNDVDNQQAVADLFAEPSTVVDGRPTARGRLLDRSLTLLETADLLDVFTYPAVESGAVDPGAASRWKAVEQIAGIGTGDPHFPVFRMRLDTDPASWGAENPNNVAAYLRFWSLALERRVSAAFSTDEPPQRWSTIDLVARADEAPNFRVGLRFGPGDRVEKGPLAGIGFPVNGMERTVTESRLTSRWGARTRHADGTIWGDEFFDCYPTQLLPDLTPSRSRDRGTSGLLLIHVIQQENGVSLAPALSIPVGGPDQLHAIKENNGGG